MLSIRKTDLYHYKISFLNTVLAKIQSNIVMKLAKIQGNL